MGIVSLTRQVLRQQLQAELRELVAGTSERERKGHRKVQQRLGCEGLQALRFHADNQGLGEVRWVDFNLSSVANVALSSELSEAEIQVLQEKAQLVAKDVTDILSVVPSELLLLFKTK